MYDKDWRRIEKHIGTRTCSQIRSHAQKFFLRLGKQISDVEVIDVKEAECVEKESPEST